MSANVPWQPVFWVITRQVDGRTMHLSRFWTAVPHSEWSPDPDQALVWSDERLGRVLPHVRALDVTVERV